MILYTQRSQTIGLCRRLYAVSGGGHVWGRTKCSKLWTTAHATPTAEVKLRAERRGGELLCEDGPGHGGDRKSESRSRDVTLTDLGVSRMQSSRWQRLAGIPEAVFEEHVVTISPARQIFASKADSRLDRTSRRGMMYAGRASLYVPAFGGFVPLNRARGRRSADNSRKGQSDEDTEHCGCGFSGG